MISRRQIAWFFATLLLLALPSTGLLAQNQDNAGAPSNDPPARVARIQYISGEVSLQPGGVNDWVAANLNRPLTTSDRVWTDKESRTELNLGGGFIRMNSESSLTLTNVSDNTIQMQLDQGVLELTVRHLENGEIYEVDTPNLAFTVMKAGVYRFDVYPNEDQTWVTVRKGSGEATGRGAAVKVSDGHQVRFSGQNSLQHVAESAPALDGFDDWANVRDKRFDSSESARYVAPGVIGYEDLDNNGRWQVAPTYGAIWIPTSVPVGWAPYRNGHWVWIAPWGWTWVDNASWGFAPFHYGRWVAWGGGWGWAPGPIIGVGWRPFWAPALVGWIGGAGWGVNISFGFGGGCGWFPLGWGEPFYPWYRGSRGGFVSQNYIRNINVTNTRITNITNVTNNYYNNNINNGHYANRNIAGAVTAAPKSALASGQNIARVGMAVPRSELGRGEVVRSADVTPNRGAVLGGQNPRNTGIPPRGTFDRPVVTRASAPGRAIDSQLSTGNQQAPNSGAIHGPNSQAATNPLPGSGSRNTQAAMPGSNVPRPAVDTGYSNRDATQASPAATAHNVPRPPDRGTTGASTTAGYPSHAGYPSQSGYSSQSANGPQAAYSHAVPRPPATSEALSHGSAAATQVSHQTPPPAHQSAPQPRTAPAEKQSKSNPNPGSASMRAPQPSAGYTYHAAPAYSASSYNAGSSRSYGGSSRAYNPAASSYTSGASSYGAAPPRYGSSGNYAATPSYSAKASAPAVQHYSAPTAVHYSGGGGSSSNAHYSGGGGGSSHASSGHGGGHSR